MINFRTEVPVPKANKPISYRKNILMVGSCFTENIGNYLQNHHFPVLTNPCGILYNPASMASCIDFLVREKQLVEADLFYANGLWNSYHFHSRFSHPEPDKALTGMNDSLRTAAIGLRSASHLFLTFGTSWIYRENNCKTIVGNCHKLPASTFSRERLTVDWMSELWEERFNQLFNLHPDLQVVLTISPIRHLKDGSYENQVSKSSLFLLVDKLISRFGTDKIAYFPSYELVMDELRDYRFYATDLLHLSELATHFVQEKFNEAFLDTESNSIRNDIGKMIKTLSHKPFQVSSPAYLDVLNKLAEEVKRLIANHPGVNLNDLIIEINQKKGS
jgi:GSCFA family